MYPSYETWGSTGGMLKTLRFERWLRMRGKDDMFVREDNILYLLLNIPNTCILCV